MKITHFFKKPEAKKDLEAGAVIQFVIDESTVRMCLRYGVNPGLYMQGALLDHLHTCAITRESSYFGERKVIQPIFIPGRDPK